MTNTKEQTENHIMMDAVTPFGPPEEKFNPDVSTDVDLLRVAVAWLRRVTGKGNGEGHWMPTCVQELLSWVVGGSGRFRNGDLTRELAATISYMEKVRAHPKMVEAVRRSAIKMFDAAKDGQQHAEGR